MTAAGRVRGAGVWLDGHAYVALPVMLAVVVACAVVFAVTWASRHPELTVVRPPSVTAAPAARQRPPAVRVTVTRPARTVTAYPAAVPAAPAPASPAGTARHSTPPPVSPPPASQAATPPPAVTAAPTLTPEPAPTPAPPLTLTPAPSPTLSESDPGTGPGTPFASVTASATPLDTGTGPAVSVTGTAPGQPATADTTTSSGGPP